MTNSISLGQAVSQNSQGVLLREALHELYKAAERRHLREEDASFIPDILCNLRTPKVLGSRVREKRMTLVKQSLQVVVAVPE